MEKMVSTSNPVRRVPLEDLTEDPHELLMFMVNNDLPESTWGSGEWRDWLEGHPREARNSVAIFDDWKYRRLNGGIMRDAGDNAGAIGRRVRPAYDDDEKLEGEVDIG